MLRSRSTASRKTHHLPTSKELDLLILAGCSCLMTILYHPVTSALQSASAAATGPGGAIASEVSRTPAQSSPVHTTLPPKQESLRKEEEEEG
jgi:hypothetical protein